MDLSRKFLARVSIHFINVILFFLMNHAISYADVREDLELLRDRCLYYSIGHAPKDTNSKTIRYGLYAQSPFSRENENQIDIAASGFALASLPLAVERIDDFDSSDAYVIALNASRRIKEMVIKSAQASTQDGYNKYGFKGMLYHYYIWDGNEFIGDINIAEPSEVSSIDTALLMYGLMICANYFEGEVLNNYIEARDNINWREWIDTSTPNHVNQFRMSYNDKDNPFSFSGHWDWRSEETMLICLFAAMSDSTLNIKDLWNAWNKSKVTYRSPAPNSKSFTCYATWNGDPFTVFYGSLFFKFRTDLNGINWFSQSKIAYTGHVEFFKKERGYLDYMTFAFSDGSQGSIAEPKSNSDTPITRTDCPIYSLAGGLDYYSKNINSNPIANTISSLVQKTNFFEWTGWPPESVNALTSNHDTYNNAIIGQNIASIAISIDNYLTNRVHDLVMQDNDLKRVFTIIMHTNISQIIVPLLLD